MTSAYKGNRCYGLSVGRFILAALRQLVRDIGDSGRAFRAQRVRKSLRVCVGSLRLEFDGDVATSGVFPRIEIPKGRRASHRRVALLRPLD